MNAPNNLFSVLAVVCFIIGGIVMMVAGVHYLVRGVSWNEARKSVSSVKIVGTRKSVEMLNRALFASPTVDTSDKLGYIASGLIVVGFILLMAG